MLLVLLPLLALAHDFDDFNDHHVTLQDKDLCASNSHQDFKRAFPWIQEAHIVSMTHLDVGGWGPASAQAPGSPAETQCPNDCKYPGDVCDAYTGGAGQTAGGYIAAALATARELAGGNFPPPPPGTVFPTCFPGHARTHTRAADCACPGYSKSWSSTDCEAAGCCTDAALYHNATDKAEYWCYPRYARNWTAPNGTGADVGFVYTTHPWIMSEYLTGAARCGSSARNATKVAAVEAAVRAGGVFAWHGKALTMVHELCDPDIYAWSLTLAKSLNARYNVSHGTVAAKVTDLPGVSIALVPLLARAGIKALHIGTNGMGGQAFSSFPGVGNLPQVFRWRHPATGDEIVVINEQHYGGTIVLDDRSFSAALRFQFTLDNRPSPDAAKVRACWAQAAKQFPNATLKASTLDAFGQLLWDARDRLPLVEAEIGNAWLPQMGTDPARLRALRGIARLRREWLAAGKLDPADPDLAGYSARLVVPVEHNYGMAWKKTLSARNHDANWTNAQFHPLREHGGRSATGCSTHDGSCDGFAVLEAYANKKQDFLRPMPGGASASPAYGAFAAEVNRTIDELWRVPSLAAVLAAHPGLVEQPDLAALSLENGRLKLAFSAATGAVTSLLEKATGVDWAAGGSIGEFVYRTYTQEQDFDRYVCQFTPDYCNGASQASDSAGAFWNKEGMDASILADPAMAHLLPLSNISRAWDVRLARAWRQEAAGAGGAATMLLQLALPADAVALFGGMAVVYLNVTLEPAPAAGAAAGAAAAPAAEDVVSITLSWTNKTATRLAESSWLTFAPAVPTPNASASASHWRMDVLGQPVDPLSVVVNGSRHFHAVHRGVCYDDSTTRLAIDTIDAPLVAPGGAAHLINFDNELPDLARGWAFNLHNNAGWDASAPYW